MSIELTTGSVVTAKSGSLDIYAFHRKSVASSEQPLHIAVKDSQSGIREIGGTIEIIPSGNARTNKSWTKKRLDSADKGYIKFLVKRTTPGVSSFGGSMSAFLIAPRKTAPLQQIGIELPTDRESAMSKLYIIGRFDLLTFDEVQSLGLGKTSSGSNELHLYDPEGLEDIFTLEVLEDQTAPKLKPKVRTTTTGGKREGVLRVRRPRSIRTV